MSDPDVDLLNDANVEAEGMPNDQDENSSNDMTDISMDVSTQPPIDSTDPDAILQLIFDIVKEESSSNPRRYPSTEHSLEANNELLSNVDTLLALWKEQPNHHPNYLKGTITASQPKADKYNWVEVGALCWVKHTPYEWWPCFIKSVKIEKGVLTKAAVCFIEPIYEHWQYYRKTPLYQKPNNLQHMVAMPVSAQENARPDEDVYRSKKSWLVCGAYKDCTMFELAERMAAMFTKLKSRIVMVDERGLKKINFDLLDGLYWYANVIWCGMNGARTVLPEAPRSCTEWEPYLAELEDVSFWRLASDVTDYPSSNKQRKKDDETEDVEDDDADGCGGYGYIQLPERRRDPSTIHYLTDESRILAEAREAYGQQLLDVINSSECQQYLRALRDSEVTAETNTWRTRALKTKQTWKLLKGNREIASPTGPIVVDSQVLAAYRAPKALRRRTDISNVYFFKHCYEVWLPEALIFAIMKVKNCTYQEAEEEYQASPVFTPEEIAEEWKTADTLSIGATDDSSQ